MAAPGQGLSRRRVGPTDGSSVTSPTMSSLESPVPTSGGMEGRSKIAFDPRDFSDGGESKGIPKLTLLEEVLLLGLKDNQVRFCSRQTKASAPSAHQHFSYLATSFSEPDHHCVWNIWLTVAVVVRCLSLGIYVLVQR